MKKSLITIVILAIIIGGIWWFGKKAEAPVSPVATTTPVQVSQPLTTERILNSNGFVNGEMEDAVAHASNSIPKDQIVFGDLTGDGIWEAVAPVMGCGAACGQSIYVFSVYRGNVLMEEIPGTGVVGAAQKIDSLKIVAGKVVVTETDFDGTRTNSYKVKFINGEMFVQ